MILNLLNIASINQATDYINKINLNNPTWDVFLILFFITFSFFYGIFLGRDKIIHILISSIFAYILVINTSFLDFLFKNIENFQLSFVKVGIFIVFVFLFFFLLAKKSVLSGIDSFVNKWWHTALYSGIHTGLFISMILHILDKKLLNVFGNIINKIFISDISFFLWILASILALIVLKHEELE